MGVKGYKVFNPDWTCNVFKYEVGRTYTHDGDIGVCKAGFHFCQNLSACFKYYPFDSSNRVAEIEAIGNVKTMDDKSVTDKIKIIREILWNEVLELVNTGIDCIGFGNSGYGNTGDWNTGNWNTGNHNTGHWNTGNRNTGCYNSGDGNTGDWNTGNWNTGSRNAGCCNSGDGNTGDWNTGNWNSIDYSSGFFNTISQPIMAFNKPLEISRIAFINTKGMRLLDQKLNLTVWIPTESMSDAEKKEHPDHKTHGGYLKTNDFKTACRQMWANFTDGERQAVREIPNFDPDVFEEITGIDARE